MVKNPLSSVGDVGSVPGWGTRILHAVGQPSLGILTMEPVHSGAQVPHLERSLCAALKTQYSQR